MYAVISSEAFSLRAVLRLEAVACAEAAVVLVDAGAAKPVVLEMTEAAAREGVAHGLSVAQALARCGELSVRYRSEQAERVADELLFGMAYSLSPRVEREAGGEVLVDLRGTQLKESVERCVAIVGELAELGLPAGIGVAESWVIAGLASRRGLGRVVLVGLEGISDGPWEVCCLKAFMAEVPLRAVGVSASLGGVLEKWGVASLAKFAALKRAAVGARLGLEGLELWDRVTGREQRVVGVAALPEVFEESWDFEYDVDSVEPLLFLLRRFLDGLSVRLRASHQVASFARVELGVAYGEPVLVEQKLPEPTSDAGALFSLLAARLDVLEADSPVARLALRLDVVAQRQRQLGLFESSLKNPYRFTQTLSQVAGIVGEDRVGRPVASADGRPDGFVLEELPTSVPPVGALELGRMYGLPLRRYRPGRAAAVEFQGRLPVWIRCEGVTGFVKAARGPWLLSGSWWEGSWSRVEWDVELNKGGLYRISRGDAGWSVDGEYS